MIDRIENGKQDSNTPPLDIWTKLAAPLAPENIQWRQDGRATQRDGKFFARFVAYIDAQFVRARFDSVVPGEWDLTLELLPAGVTEDGEINPAFKARLQVLGVIREDVGSGKDYKSAASDAFKRAAVRFGVGHELYAFDQNWVQVDSDSKFAKPVEDPAAAYARRGSRPASQPTPQRTHAVPSNPEPYAAPDPQSAPLDDMERACPKCGGKTWDNRVGKRNPKAPDFRCRDRACDGAVWPPKEKEKAPARKASAPARDRDREEEEDDDLPF